MEWRDGNHGKILPFPQKSIEKDVPVYHYFCLSRAVPDIKTGENRQNFSLSFRKVPKYLSTAIFTFRGQADSQ